MDKRQQFGMAGSLILGGGVFAPFMSAPFIGTINYLANGEGDGRFILVLATISLLLVLPRRYKGLWATGLIALAALLYILVNFLQLDPFLRAFVRLEWGWGVMLVGVILILAVAKGFGHSSAPAVTQIQVATSARLCGSCGGTYPHDYSFCTMCGKPLTQGSPVSDIAQREEGYGYR